MTRNAINPKVNIIERIAKSEKKRHIAKGANSGTDEREQTMKIITKADQDRATAYLMQIISAIKSNDDMELLQSLDAVAELAFILGGVPMMETLKGGWV